MHAFRLDLTLDPPQRALRIVKMAEKNKRLIMREIDMKRFDEEVAVVLDIYNEAWSDNWAMFPLLKQK